MIERSLISIFIVVSACGDSTIERADSGASDSGAPVDGSIGEDGGPTDAGVDAGEPCDTPGMMRTAPCGRCGTGPQRCEGGIWGPVTECFGEGECLAGEIERRATMMCGEESRLCDDACAWGGWENTTPDMGECIPGTMRMDPADCPERSTREQTCRATCMWESTGPCSDECGDAPRETPADSIEVCIPAGPFIRGVGTMWPDGPEAEVSMSAYYIDKYPVTNRRYRECVTAGACTMPMVTPGPGSFMDATRDAYLVQGVSWEQARAFCEWDGRRLPTEAQWEKAGRGPAPSRVLYPWGGTEWDCDIAPSGTCGFMPADPILLPDRFDGLPGTASVYGVEMLIGGGRDWVSDWFDGLYYSDPSSRADPQGPAAPDAERTRVIRGVFRYAAGPGYELTRRGALPAMELYGWTTIRCARDGVGVD